MVFNSFPLTILSNSKISYFMIYYSYMIHLIEYLFIFQVLFSRKFWIWITCIRRLEKYYISLCFNFHTILVYSPLFDKYAWSNLASAIFISYFICLVNNDCCFCKQLWRISISLNLNIIIFHALNFEPCIILAKIILVSQCLSTLFKFLDIIQ